MLDALTNRLRSTSRLLLKELGAFGVVGAVCFVLQIACFQLLVAHLGVGPVLSNLIATVVSMTAAYIGHRYWSFAHRTRSSVRREYVLFAAINGVTLLLGLAVVALVSSPPGEESTLVLQIGNIGSIVLGTVIRYLGYRRWVFTAPAAPAEPVAERPVAPRSPDLV